MVSGCNIILVLDLCPALVLMYMGDLVSIMKSAALGGPELVGATAGVRLTIMKNTETESD